MSELSRFYGLIIRMYYDESLSVLKGYLPARALALVVEWGLLHREELLARWRAAENYEELLKIDPLP